MHVKPGMAGEPAARALGVLLEGRNGLEADEPQPEPAPEPAADVAARALAPGARVSFEPNARTLAVDDYNVAGVLAARGSSSSDYVVLTAHYDHLGVMRGTGAGSYSDTRPAGTSGRAGSCVGPVPQG